LLKSRTVATIRRISANQPLSRPSAKCNHKRYEREIVDTRGLQGDVVYLCWLIAPLVYEPKCGRGCCGVSANENSCAHHVTWSPNKLWRSNSIF
jgi:hypothetical protein